MKALNEYKIPYTGLKAGRHQFEFQLEDKFFSCFEYSQIAQARIHVITRLEKQSVMLILDSQLSGEVNADCDRCGDACKVQIEGEYRLIVKFGERTERLDEDIFVIGPNEHLVDMSEFLYEFAHLALPLRRIHENPAHCNPEVLEKLNEFLVEKRDDEADDFDEQLN